MGGDQEAYNALYTAGETIAIVGTALLMPYTGNVCLVAGTAVLTIKGAKTIETIQIGELVLSIDDFGIQSYQPVLQLFVNNSTELIHISIGDGQVITSTPTHPYYCVERGWIAAADLRAGDKLLLSNGHYVIVELVQHEILELPALVYNFEVANNHNYYVSASVVNDKNSFVLAHNNCGFSNKSFKVGNVSQDPLNKASAITLV